MTNTNQTPVPSVTGVNRLEAVAESMSIRDAYQGFPHPMETFLGDLRNLLNTHRIATTPPASIDREAIAAEQAFATEQPSAAIAIEGVLALYSFDTPADRHRAHEAMRLFAKHRLGDRQLIARIIDPVAWECRDNPGGYSQNAVDHDCDESLTKADAIIASLPTSPPRADTPVEGREQIARAFLAKWYDWHGEIDPWWAALGPAHQALALKAADAIMALPTLTPEIVAERDKVAFEAGFHAAERALGFEGCDESQDAFEIEWSDYRAAIAKALS